MPSPRVADIQQRVFENIAPLLGIPDASFEPGGIPPATLDFWGTLFLRGKQIPVAGEVKSVGEPWAIRSAIHRLSEHRDQHPQYLPLLLSESIGPKGRALCKRYRIAYIDLSGNCYLEGATSTSTRLATALALGRPNGRNLYSQTRPRLSSGLLWKAWANRSRCGRYPDSSALARRGYRRSSGA